MTCPNCGVPVEAPGLCLRCWDFTDEQRSRRVSARDAQIAAAKAAGASVEDLARQFHISKRTVYRALRRAGYGATA